MTAAVWARAAMSGWLLAVWVALWGNWDGVTLVGGAAAVAVTYWATRFPALPLDLRVRPRAALAALADFIAGLAAASAVIGWYAVTNPRGFGRVVMPVRALPESDAGRALLVTVLCVRPGTVVIAVDRPRSLLLVHCMPITDRFTVDDVRGGLRMTQRTLIRAFGTAADIAALERAHHHESGREP